MEAELRSDLFKKSRLYSKGDDGGNDKRRSDRRGTGGGEGGSTVKRRRESDSDDYNGGYVNRERGGGGKRGSFSGNSRGKRRFGGEFGSRNEGFVSRREDGFENGRGGGRGSGNSRGRGRGRYEGEVERRNDGFSHYSNREKGDWGSFDSFLKVKERYICDTKREDDRFVTKRKDDRFNGSGRGRGGGGGGGVRTGAKSMGRGSLAMSDEDSVDDEEGEEKLMHSFRELISDEDDNDEQR